MRKKLKVFLILAMILVLLPLGAKATNQEPKLWIRRPSSNKRLKDHCTT